MRERLMIRQRNYAYYRHSIYAASALLKTKPELVEKLRDTLIALDKEIGEKERAPRLAQLELDNMLVTRSSPLAMGNTEWEGLVSSYWNRWGSKGSTVAELEGIVGERKEWLRETMKERVGAGHVSWSLAEIVRGRR